MNKFTGYNYTWASSFACRFEHLVTRMQTKTKIQKTTMSTKGCLLAENKNKNPKTKAIRQWVLFMVAHGGIQTPLTWACGECSVKKQQQKSQTHRCQGCQAISREMCLRVVLLGRARLVARGRLEGLNFRRQFISPFIGAMSADGIRSQFFSYIFLRKHF